MRDIGGEGDSGGSSIRFITKIQKKSDAMNGRYASPFLPSTGRRIWSRTARMPISARDCVRPGIIFGLANATKKKTMIASTHRIAISAGLVTCHAPIWNSVWKLKSCSPGAGYPHPLKMCELSMVQFVGVEATRAPVTDHLPSGDSPAHEACRTGK